VTLIENNKRGIVSRPTYRDIKIPKAEFEKKTITQPKNGEERAW